LGNFPGISYLPPNLQRLKISKKLVFVAMATPQSASGAPGGGVYHLPLALAQQPAGRSFGKNAYQGIAFCRI